MTKKLTYAINDRRQTPLLGSFQLSIHIHNEDLCEILSIPVAVLFSLVEYPYNVDDK